ncbi:MAG: alpha-amylase family glycosyl hydrolase, partial [Thermotogota bacterium]
SSQRGELDMVFTFEHTDYYKAYGKNPKKLKAIITNWQQELHHKGWSGICFSNHDLPRIVSCFGLEGQYRQASAKLFATLLLTLEGTPFIYQGDELGLPDTRYDTIEEYDDISAKKLYRERKRQGIDEHTVMKEIQKHGRDRSRSPMHWDNSEYLGFSKVQPWIKPNRACANINVADSIKQEGSVLNYYKEMIKIRKEKPTLVFGNFELLVSQDEIFAFRRFDKQGEFLIILNVSEEKNEFIHPLLAKNNLKVVINNYSKVFLVKKNKIAVKPYQAVVLQL